MSCTVTETLNGEWELTLVHDIDERGKWKRLSEGCILRAPVPAAMTPSVDLVTQQYQTSTYDVQIYKITTKSGPLHLRSGTGTNYKILGKYKKGREVIVLNKTTSSWYEVTAPDGKHGYMASQYLTFQRTETQTVQTNVGFRNHLVSTNTCAFQLTVPASVVPSISNVAVSEATSGVADRFGGYVRTRSKLLVSITAAGAQGSSISAYRTSIDGVTYSGSSFTTNALNTAGNLTLTVTVTDSRGRTASTTRTVTVLDYSPPSLSQFTAERCNADGTVAQTDGTKVRISAKASGSSVGGKNTLACTVYYKLSSAESWVSAVTLAPSDYVITAKNRLLSPTFDALSSYDIKIRVQDVFYYIEQTVSIGTKQVMMDFYKDGSGIAFGKVAENAGKVEFGWPLLLSEPLGVDQGGTGAETASAACTKLGTVKKSGDTMTGNLAISGYLYPSLYLLPTYNSTTNRTVFEGSYVGASSFSSWEDGTGNNRRMLEVRNAAYQASLDFAVLLRTCTGGTWASYRLFHAGMATPIPLANGGTGASSAKAALSNLGIFYSASLPSSGTDGQICLVPV